MISAPTARPTAVSDRAGYEVAKRAVDLAGAAVALVVLGPVMLAIAVLVRSTSRGPALFRQERVGRDGAPFVCLKFRTMHVDSDDVAHRVYVTRLLEGDRAHGGEEGVFKLTDDQRVTRIGSVLRRTSLDELPQLLNVLRGDMSLVGPRPVLPWEAELFAPRHRHRFAVKPGITGLWQVEGRSRLDYQEALELDRTYVDTRSLALDLRILARTLPAVLDRDAAR